MARASRDLLILRLFIGLFPIGIFIVFRSGEVERVGPTGR